MASNPPRLLPVALAAALCVASAASRAQPPAANALPVVNGSVVPRNATIGPQGGTAAAPVMTITQNASRGVIEWQSFDIGAASRVNIVQPSAQSVLVNRVTPAGTATTSQIYGQLNANGRVFLVNPAGVTFGAGAQVNVGSLVASTLDLSPAQVANHYEALVDPANGSVFLTPGGNGAVRVESGAVLRADPAGGGSVVLVGQQGVSQAGLIEAVRGHIALGTASSAQVVLPASSSGFIDLVVTAPASGRGPVELAAGSLTSAAAGSVHVTGHELQVDGTVSTDAPQGTGGAVRLDAGPGGSVLIGTTGRVTATGERGGQVTATGRSVVFAAGDGAPAIDASGSTAGGSITVGGDDTREVYVGRGRVLAADATDLGQGGRIIVKANHLDRSATAPVARQDYGVAEVYGTLLARGGVRGGDGGFIETSGRALSTRADSSALGSLVASVDARARTANGTAGTWLIDPFNVTIGNGLQTQFVNQWTPTGTGAQIASGDITAALNAGTSVEVNTGTTATGTETGTITLLNGTIISRTTAGAATTLTFRAHDGISADATTITASNDAPVNVNFHADLDGNGTGNVVLVNTGITSGGGNVSLGGGLDPVTGFARGNGQQAGVALTGVRIVTSGNLGTGDVVVRGQGGAGSADAGVAITNSSIDANDLTVLGRANQGAGVVLQNVSFFSFAGGIDVRGVATRTNGGASQAVGLVAIDTAIRVNGGPVTLAGRGDDALVVGTYPAAEGIRYSNLTILAPVGNTSTITLAGEAARSTGAGIRFTDTGTGGLTLIADQSTNLPTLANVSLGAISSDGLAMVLGLDTNPNATDVRTTGSINFRPVGVTDTGDVADAVDTAITVGPAGTSTTGFFVDSTRFGTRLQAGAGFSIGSGAHRGAIAVADGALTGLRTQSVTLQNEGTGPGDAVSQGIVLGSGVQLANLALLSSGEVTQTAGFAVDGNLLLGGGGNHTLESAGNTVAGAVGLSNPRNTNVLVDGALTMGPVGPMARVGAEGNFTSVAVLESTASASARLRSTNGAVTVNNRITLGNGGQLVVVSPVSIDVELVNGSLNAPGGRAQAWAPIVNWTVADRLNLYGCTYPACTLSGITPPNTGVQALLPTRPTVTVVADPASGTAGNPPPPFTYTTTGFQAGDSAATALAGTLATAADAQSPAGTYAVSQGTLLSPTGYLIAFTGASYTVAAGQVPPTTPPTPPSLFTPPGAEQVRSVYLGQHRSDVYGRNLALPFICTAQSVVRDTVAQETHADPLAAEWGKVRNQPNLSGCLEVTQGGQCAAF